MGYSQDLEVVCQEPGTKASQILHYTTGLFLVWDYFEECHCEYSYICLSFSGHVRISVDAHSGVALLGLGVPVINFRSYFNILFK